MVLIYFVRNILISVLDCVYDGYGIYILDTYLRQWGKGGNDVYWILATLLVLLVFIVRRLLPVKGLHTIDTRQLNQQIDDESVLILDVRDPVDYEHTQVSGSLNIYVGRLPHVNKEQLDITKQITIVAASAYQLRRAARILRKSGFTKLTGHVWTCMDQALYTNHLHKKCCA